MDVATEKVNELDKKIMLGNIKDVMKKHGILDNFMAGLIDVYGKGYSDGIAQVSREIDDRLIEMGEKITALEKRFGGV